tara:strand:- start:435 stop:830 length:396 start_codon:yes stop_codon:yes gene_type:complete
MNEEWVPLDSWWIVVKAGQSRSFMKKFEKELNQKGYSINRNKSKASTTGTHMKLAIIEDSTGSEKMALITPVDKGKAVKNAVAQVIGLFSGRSRRGQGTFRLDDGNIENMGPLGALLVGGAAQAGKTILED